MNIKSFAALVLVGLTASVAQAQLATLGAQQGMTETTPKQATQLTQNFVNRKLSSIPTDECSETTVNDPTIATEDLANCLKAQPFDFIMKMATTIGITNIYEIQTISPQAASSNKKNQTLNLDVLLAPLAYQQGTQESFSSDIPTKDTPAPLNFIKFLSGQANPLVLYTMNEFTTKNLQTPLAQAEYINRLRHFISLASVGISNLNRMYADRLPNPETANVSRWQFEAKQAADSLCAPDWQKTVTDIQQRTFCVLAQINRQLLQSRIQNERVLATLSAMQLQDLDLNIKSTVKQ